MRTLCSEDTVGDTSTAECTRTWKFVLFHDFQWTRSAAELGSRSSPEASTLQQPGGWPMSRVEQSKPPAKVTMGGSVYSVFAPLV